MPATPITEPFLGLVYDSLTKAAEQAWYLPSDEQSTAIIWRQTSTPIADGDTTTVTDAGESIAVGLTDADITSVVDAEAIAVGLGDGDAFAVVESMSIVVTVLDADVVAVLDAEGLSVAVTDAELIALLEATSIDRGAVLADSVDWEYSAPQLVWSYDDPVLVWSMGAPQLVWSYDAPVTGE